MRTIVLNIRRGAFFLSLLLLAGFTALNAQSLEGFKIAFIADAHFHDVYCDFTDTDQKIIFHPISTRNTTIRTMNSQLNSTRLFNENYFAFFAALDDIAEKGVKCVVLPGDFSDNGQPMNVRGVKNILDEYSEKYDMKFFITTGNHDPSRPYLSEGGHKDFLGEGGKQQPVMSQKGLYTPKSKNELPVIITKDVQNSGYREITSVLQKNGFFPQRDYLYWETPFSSYNLTNYSFEKASEEAALEKRMYETANNSLKLPDVSYLAEPVEGLWLLAIDANVYIPKKEVTNNNEDPANYTGSSVGYNELIIHKKHIIDWVRTVADRAKKNGKMLITFSHYPMVEYNDNASHEIKELLGDNKMQLNRVPSEEVSRIFADAGVSVHFAGHMHINDTGVKRTDKGNFLFNIQVPSLAAYIPAYKLLTIKNKDQLEIETIILDSVPRFNELFDLYRIEHAYLKEIGASVIWNIEILSSGNYHEFATWHLKELIRLRLFPNDWPSDLKNLLPGISGQDMLIMSQLRNDNISEPDLSLINNESYINTESWKQATQKAAMIAERNNISFNQFDDWTGSDLIFDFYRLKNADELAVKDIGELRIKQYKLLNELFESSNNSLPETYPPSNINIESQKVGKLLKIVCMFLNGYSSDHFLLDLKKGEISRVCR